MDLSSLSAGQLGRVRQAMHRSNIGVWAEDTFGLVNAPFHWEWYKLLHERSRLTVVSPRDSAKSQAITVNSSAWRAIFRPGCWVYLFAATADLSYELKSRVDDAVGQADPRMVSKAATKAKRESIYANGSRVSAAGARVAVRGQHPDFIIGDDVLEEDSTLTAYQRGKTSRWWHGTVAGMSHPATHRVVNGVRREFPPTQIVLVGTPFTQTDLLMETRHNPRYTFRRYASEFDPADLRDGWAVEYTGLPVREVRELTAA